MSQQDPTPTPSPTADDLPNRRQVVASMVGKQRKNERRRTIAGVSVLAVAGVALVGFSAASMLKNHPSDPRPLAKIGATAATAGCQAPVTASATGNNDHRNIGEVIDYQASPPSSGPHWPIPEDMERKFYTPEDRPEVEVLVHNLEHGFTVVWYDPTLPEADIKDLRGISTKFPNTTGIDDKFIVAPWTNEDGDKFPNGAKVALTHWSNGGTNGNAAEQTGVTLHCAKPSGEVVKQFVEDYPFTDAPEGGLPGDM